MAAGQINRNFLFRNKILKNIVKSRFLSVNERTKCCSINRTLYSNANGTKNHYDIVIVGGGIIGASSARLLKIRHPNLDIALVEKEKELSLHQSGSNSGVIHAGIYYKPGSLKAKLCVEGLTALYKYCDENDIPYKKCGKLIVAVTQDEVKRLDDIFSRGVENKVPDLKLIGPAEIPEIEPNCRGLAAVYSPNTGIIDYKVVTKSFGKTFKNLGGDIYTNFKVNGFISSHDPEYPVQVTDNSSNKYLNAKYVLTCGGLYADKLAAISGCKSVPKIVPFRGEYLLLKPEKSNMVKGNIYPVPNPKFPFLGVHFTPRMDGSVWLGPNAVLATKREGYRLTDFSLKEFSDAVGYIGLQKLVLRNLNYGLGELYRGINISAQVKILKRFVPCLQYNDVTRGPAGVRAQALDVDGNLVDDFVFKSGRGALAKRMLNVCNAPSPAATSSIAIGRMVTEEATKQFQL